MKRESFVWERANALRLKRSNARKRSKLWGSDSANNASRVASGDRVGGDIFCDDGAGADNDTVTQGDSFENDGASSNEAAAADFHRFGVFGVFGKP